MALIGEDYQIIGKMLENNGFYPEDPQALAISSYLNDWGGRTFHVSYNSRDLEALLQSPHCREIKKLWGRETGITEEGKEILKKYKGATQFMTPGQPTQQSQPPERKGGFHLKYRDFKSLERIIEGYHLFPEGHDLAGEVDHNDMPDDEKDILWKIKTVIRNMESVRLRTNLKGEENDTL